jgi:hypothetical protein
MRLKLILLVIVILSVLFMVHATPLPASAGSGSISVSCGSLIYRWGSWRITNGLYPYETYTVYFNPGRTGYHILQTYQVRGSSSNGDGMYVGAAWSNNGGGTWNTWTTLNLTNGATQNLTLYSGSSNITYRFTFAYRARYQANQAMYVFYCDRYPWSTNR